MSDFRQHYRQGYRYAAALADGRHALGATADDVIDKGALSAILPDGSLVRPWLAPNPAAPRAPAGFEGWRVDGVLPSADRVTHKKATAYFVTAPSGSTGVLLPYSGRYRFHEQLDLFGGGTPLPKPEPARQAALFNPRRASTMQRGLPLYSGATGTPIGEREREHVAAQTALETWLKLKGKKEKNPGHHFLTGPAKDAHIAAMAQRIRASHVEPSAFVRDVTPAGYGPTGDGQLPRHPSLEEQRLLASIQEARIIMRGRLAPQKRQQIERSLASTEERLMQLRIAERERWGNPAILTGQVRPDGTIATYEGHGKNRKRVYLPVPTVPDWRREMAAPPRRLSKHIGPPVSPLVKRSEQSMPVGVAYTSTGTPIEYAWQVVDLVDLKISHDPWTLQPKAGYPQELQPRDRSRKSYEDQIARLVRDFAPSLMMWSATVADGAPVVGADDGVVESGNGRMMALSRVYKAGGDKAEAYRKTAKEWADFLGAKWHKYDKPVLVRVRQTEIDRAEFARSANVAGQQIMAAAEQAIADANAMPLEMVRLYQPGSGMGTRANAPFVEAFVRQVSGPTSRGEMLTGSGSVSKAGEARIDLAMFAKAWGPESEPLLTAWGEDPESDLRVIIGAMADAAPAWLSLAATVADGMYLPKYLIGGSVVEAAIVFRAAKQKGQHVLSFLRQADIVQQPSALAELWIQAAHPHGSRASRKALTAALVTYCELVEQQGPVTQGSMFGPSEAAPIDLARRAVRLASSAE